MSSTNTLIGSPQSRVDGPLKVTGAAQYAAEVDVPGLLHGVVVSSSIARGKIVRIDTRAARALDGVVHVFTHENRPDLPAWGKRYKDMDAVGGTPFRALYDADVKYSGQPVALVVASSFEAARAAAQLVDVQYEVAEHHTDLEARRDQARTPRMGKSGFELPKSRGQAAQKLADAPVSVEAEYSTPAEHHNPMECHVSTVVHEDDGSLTVYDKTQGTLNTLAYVCLVFGLKPSEVHVRSPFVGGAFGSGLRPQYQLLLAVMAARELKRAVRVELTRPQMFTFGHRPQTLQRIALGASREGELQAIVHHATAETSSFEDYVEVVVNWSGMLYKCDHVELGYEVVSLDTYTPLDMRAPGATLGVFALECAMDELAYAVKVDPIALRLTNYAETDQNKGLPFSSKELRACFRQGAERFGWYQRSPEPGSMKRGRQRVGQGMACGVWDALFQKASARATLSGDGRLVVASATSDIGTGTYTIMAQIAAGILELPIRDVTARLGDSRLPMAPLQGGSWTAASVGTAVKVACEALRDQLFDLTVHDGALGKVQADELELRDGHVVLRAEPKRRVSYRALLANAGKAQLEADGASSPDPKVQKQYSMASHSAVFVEVEVDEDLGSVRVTRVVSAIAGGKILNPKTARSQILGSVVWGIGMALQEESRMDTRLGRYVNRNLAEYHIPVHADIADIDVIFVDEHDDVVNPLGVKGLGEIGLVGVAAAVANAVYHATGKRIRSLPITLDKLL